jgi:thymidylate synthase
MNKLDKDYQALLQDILDNGVTKKDRTGTGTISVFGRQIRHKMSDGFPLLTTKKMYFKGIVTELIWFLRGDTNIKYLVDNNCHIWDGDAYKNYTQTKVIKTENGETHISPLGHYNNLSQEEFINRIKTDDEFAKKFGNLGPVYGKQWRKWTKKKMYLSTDGSYENIYDEADQTVIDQISILINDLKTNPDSRRLMVNAWNVGELDQMVLPPCHYGFQVYTRELSLEERQELQTKMFNGLHYFPYSPGGEENIHKEYDRNNVPRRAISLMWNQRSVDTPLGLPFNIASYGLLLTILGKMVNMVPDELIGNLGDCHIYLNQVDGVKEQIGREYSLEERLNMVSNEVRQEFENGKVNLPNFPNTLVRSDEGKMSLLDDFNIPRRTREPYPLPTLKINSGNENWHLLELDEVLNTLDPDITFKVENYQSHPTIKFPLSN